MPIKIEELCRYFRVGDSTVRALDGVSLNIDDGEYVTICGASGSGKSTLMNILGCLDVPTSGRYLLDGENVTSLADDKLSHIRGSKIGFVFQSFNLIPYLTAQENVELPLMYRGIPRRQRREAAREALEQVGLLNRADHRPCEMSGGQQQRTAIARAIAGASVDDTCRRTLRKSRQPFRTCGLRDTGSAPHVRQNHRHDNPRRKHRQACGTPYPHSRW